MSHEQPCTHGFLGTRCPQCERTARADRLDRTELTLAVAEATEDTLREVAHWLINHDANALRDALHQIGATT